MLLSVMIYPWIGAQRVEGGWRPFYVIAEDAPLTRLLTLRSSRGEALEAARAEIAVERAEARSPVVLAMPP